MYTPSMGMGFFNPIVAKMINVMNTESPTLNIIGTFLEERIGTTTKNDVIRQKTKQKDRNNLKKYIIRFTTYPTNL